MDFEGSESRRSSLYAFLREISKGWPSPGRLSAPSVLKIILPSFVVNRKALRTNRTALGSTAWIDGLRGIASLLVFFFHLSFRIFDTNAVYGAESSHRQLLRLPIIRLLYSGSPMPGFFFIISGYALSCRPLQQMRAGAVDSFQTSMASAVLRRPIRLYFPCIFSSLIVFFLVRFGIYELTRPIAENTTLYSITPQETHVHREPTVFAQFGHYFAALSSLIHNGFYDNLFGGNFDYDIHLWTIPTEFRASMALFLSQVVASRMSQPTRLLFYSLLIWWSFDGMRWEMMLFYSGAIIAELDLVRASEPNHEKAGFPFVIPKSIASILPARYRQPLSSERTQPTLMTFNFLSGLYLCSFPEEKADVTPGYIIVDRLTPTWFVQHQRFWQSLGAIQVVLVISASPYLQSLLTMGPVQYLGRISYGLYLMHGPVIHTFGYLVFSAIWGFTGAVRGAGLELGFCIGAILTTGMAIWAGDLFWRGVDIPCVKFARWVAGKCLDGG